MVTDRKRKVTPLGSNSYIEDRELLEKVRKKRRRGLTRRLVVFFILVGAAAVPITSLVTSQQAVIAQKKQNQSEMKHKLAQMKKKEHNLKSEVNRLNDLDYIGKIARSNYFLTKSGETVFVSKKNKKN